ncbi:metal ABC transporter ATP-binding protein [Enterovibrio norvegicus]|uniref:Zinc ABC transporter ATP-binding protein ZnuC n=1 Tax=Enterovibrio norvegicus TaxID=188144 RepID=A0A2N7L3J6_9GAMM|nr:metal ABC transporter ATP-binding protein [Enterovibrio norvegicus]PMN87515.1 zinc ABC transporter ATP-binding protein ZnuC [Enterovibrio norvegicus]
MLIECHNVSVHLGQRNILRNINLSVHAGEIITLVGPNGAGKSTLFKTLIGALSPSSGEIHKAPDLRIGYVPQRLYIDDTLPITVSRFMNLPRVHSREVVTQALADAGVAGLDKQQVMDLSGGQFQRVLLARALLGEPNLLLLDEATQGLDHRGTADFYRQIAKVRETRGCAIVMISHELHVVMKQTDWVVCLNAHICCQGEPDVISDSHEYRALFGLDAQDDTALNLRESRRQPATGTC